MINGLSAAIGPPVWPLAIAASDCCERLLLRCAPTRSSTTSPTFQLPSPIAPGVTPARAKQSASSDTSPKRPRSTRKANAKTHPPFVGGAVRLDERQGHYSNRYLCASYTRMKSSHLYRYYGKISLLAYLLGHPRCHPIRQPTKQPPFSRRSLILRMTL